MIREEYKTQMSNEQVAVLLERLGRFTEVLRDLANLGDLYAEVGKIAISTRQSVKRGKKALDYGEFFAFIEERNPEAAEILSKAKVTKFEWGKIHLSFVDPGVTLLWRREQIELLAEKLYGVPFKIRVKAGVLE